MGFIYKITNQINNKIYIGKTQFTIDKRWKEHCYSAFENNINYPLYRAMRKYGINNFTIEEVEEVDNTVLSEREIYWIGFYHSYAPLGTGYNATLGGEGNATIDIIEVIRLWEEEHRSINYISQLLNHDRSAIRKIIQTLPSYSEQEARIRGNNWSYKENRSKQKDNNQGKPVNQYDLDGNLINTFYNTREAERQTGVGYRTIWNVVSHKQNCAGGYQWRYIDDTIPVEKLVNRRKSYPVEQYDIHNNYIATYKTAAEAERKTGVKAGQIRKACQNKISQAGNYYWKYKRGDD